MLKFCQKNRISFLAVILHVSIHAVSWAGELPGESVLPNQYIAQQAVGDQAETDAQDALENGLPGEGQLPVRQPAVEQINPAERAWLRVRAFAPTAPLRTVAFAKSSNRLFAAGEDKSLWSWRRLPPPFGARRPWRLDRAMNWPIQRAERGTINAIAVAPEGKLVAIGGNGGYGSNGDIFLFNAITGALENVLWDQNVGHRQTIVSIAFCASGTNRGLVSVDGAGKILFWEQDEGGPLETKGRSKSRSRIAWSGARQQIDGVSRNQSNRDG